MAMKPDDQTALRKPGNGALAGIRVVDFSHMLPGPWCTQMLADLGADVVKVENPGVGDYGRHNSPNFKETSVYFNTVNLNKRSAALDLTDPDDLATVHRLLASADVVIESFRDGVPQRLQIDYEFIKKTNPGIIYCSITGYGHSGPLANIPGHDLIIQSTTGVLAAGRAATEMPPLPGFLAGDYAAASYAIIGILAALRQRDATGEGRYLDISMFDSLFSMSSISNGAALASASGKHTTTSMELWGGNPRYNIYRCEDGKMVAVSLLEARIWHHFCRLIGREDLIHEAETPKDRHTDHGERARHYRDAITDLCASRGRDELVAWMVENNVPIVPVYSPDEALASAHAAARGAIEWVEHPVEGRIPVLANPLAQSGLLRHGRSPAPVLGADNASVASAQPWQQQDQ
jgi:crotonobetainyl-CoA:carnitine CoA-transferase CaiB-like acyl-CoA transferase